VHKLETIESNEKMQ